MAPRSRSRPDVKETFARAGSGAEGRRRRRARDPRQAGRSRVGVQELDGAARTTGRTDFQSQGSIADRSGLAGAQVSKAMPDNAILVDEGLTSSRQILALRPHRDRYGYHALASGGIGWGCRPRSASAWRTRSGPVVCFSGDGSAMYSIQALWTAAHHKLPLTVRDRNNGGYRIIKQRLLAFHGDDHYVGMDFVDPKVDFHRSGKILRPGGDADHRSEGFEVRAGVGLPPARRQN